jgi:hypothetical protein
MAYLLIVDQPGHTMDDFRAVSAALGCSPPEGSIAVAAGPTLDGIRVVGLWESKEHAARFSAERLGPAMAQVFGGRPSKPHVTEFELEDLRVHSASSAA